MLDFLTFALCVPYSETTDGKQFDILLEMVAERGRALFKLFQVSHIRVIDRRKIIKLSTLASIYGDNQRCWSCVTGYY